MPSFLVPIAAFVVWVGVLFSYLSVLRLDLGLSLELLAPQFFLSFLILAFAWAFSGPLVSVLLAVLSALAVAYLSLSSGEPVILLHLVVLGVLFLPMFLYLHRSDRRMKNAIVEKDRFLGDTSLAHLELKRQEKVKEALEAKIARFLDLQRFSEELKEEKDLSGAASKVVREAREALPKAEQCVLYLVDEERQELSLAAFAGEGTVKEKTGSLYERWVMKRSQAVLVEDALNDFRFPADAGPESRHLRSLCISPLVTENKVLGVLRVNSSLAGTFNADDLRLLEIFASLGAVILRNLLLYRKMSELAIRDGLTGLYLNRYFQQRLLSEIQRAQLNKVPLSLVLLDIDFFKHYNDEFGHAAGDKVLKDIADIFRRCLDSVDLVARYGGEEFVAILPNRTQAQAGRVAEKIRAEIERNKFIVRRAESRITASLGVAAFPEAGRTREELLWTADRNLYEAKNKGRNRVCGGS